MSRRNARKKRAAMGVVTKPFEVILASRDSSAKKPQEPRATDSGFAIPMQLPPGAPTLVRFYCQSTKCPGYGYAASERPHPIATCGAQYNTQDLPRTTAESEKEIMESQPLSEPNAPQPEPNSDVSTSVKAPLLSDLMDEIWCREDGAYLELLSIGKNDSALVASYQKDALGIAEWQVFLSKGSEVLALVASNAISKCGPLLPSWVVETRLNRRASFAEGIVKSMGDDTINELAKASDAMVKADPFIEETRAWCGRIASELGCDSVDVERLMGTVFQTIEQFVTLKEITSSSPVVAALLQKFKAPVARSYLFQLAEGIFKGPIRDTIEQATEEQINRFDVKLEGATTRLEELKANIESTIGNLEEQLPASDADSEPLGVQLKNLKTEVSKLLQAYEGKLESLLEKFEAVNADLSKVEQRMDDVEKAGLAQELTRKNQPGHRNTKTDQRLSRENSERRRRARRLQRELAAQPDELEEDEDELEEGDEFEGELDEEFDDELEDEDDEFEEQTGFKKPIPPKRKTTIPPAPKRGRPRKKAAKKVIGKKTAKKAASKTAPAGKGLPGQSLTPKPGVIDGFLGKDKNPAIRALLKRIHPRKLGKFLQQAQKGMPPMKLTPWKPAEQSKFAQWFYGRRRG